MSIPLTEERRVAPEPTLVLEPAGAATQARWGTTSRFAAGLLVAALVAAVAVLAAPRVPLLGPAVLAILLGMVVRTAAPAVGIQRTGVGALGHRALQVAIVLLGASVDLHYVGRVAGASLLVMLGTLSIGLVGIWQLGRLFGVDRRVRSLLCAGTSICGASAIAATAPAVGAEPGEVNYAVSVIFLFNVIAVVVFPVVGHLLHFSSHTFGLWAGTAVNDTSSVLAAGFAFGSGAASYAAIVKLSRTIMILPVTVAFALMSQRWSGRGADEPAAAAAARPHPVAAVRRAVPWFIIAFALASAAYTLGLWPSSAAGLFGQGAQYATVLALAAIGLSTDLRHVIRTGPRPILVGFFGWMLVAVSSLGLQALTVGLGR